MFVFGNHLNIKAVILLEYAYLKFSQHSYLLRFLIDSFLEEF